MTTQNTTPIIEKVKLAMLSLQRASWEQGVAAQALLELGETDLVILMAQDAVLRRLPDGRVAMLGSEHAVTDSGVNGEPLLFAARVTGDPAFSVAADGLLNYLLTLAPRAVDGTLHHLTFNRQIWIDSMYMTPFLALSGHADAALQQIEGYRRVLWDQDRKLYSHKWDTATGDFARRDFWGVGNGWTAAGLARVIKALPAQMARDRERIIGYVKALLEGILPWQRSDGLFHDVVDRPDTFVETNLAQMLAYTIYRGVQGDWLEPAYLFYADHMRAAAHAKVDALGLVQGVCGSPQFDHPGYATEGQAFFLLMEAAHRDLQHS